ncbi:hypothetical protein [Natroniella sp. ANB-PHB2]
MLNLELGALMRRREVQGRYVTVRPALEITGIKLYLRLSKSRDFWTIYSI